MAAADRPDGTRTTRARPGGAARAPRRGDPLLALWTGVAVIASALPLARVIVPAWLPSALLVVAVVLAAGSLVRRSARPGWAVAAEIAAWALCVALLLPPTVPRLVVLPVRDTFPALEALFAGASEEIMDGVAPVAPSAGLSWVLAAAFGVFAIAMAHVILTARLPLLASVGLIAVSLVPSLVVPQRVDAVFFVPSAVSILLLLHADARARGPRRDARHTASVSAVAAIVGAVTVVAALVVPPLLPEPVARPGSGFGPTTTIDADLDLGASLRQPAETEVLRITTDAGSAPYLRVATLSSFDGDVWEPDTGRLSAVGALPGVEEGTAPSVESSALVEITQLRGEYLPVPYAATELEGVDESWSMLVANRTVVSSSSTSLGAEYTVGWQHAAPTREQARAASADGASVPEQTLELPELPDVIPELAAELTSGAENPYDELRALQSWFRGGEFAYSLDAPVEEGFDGSGVDAIAEFLDVRAGYCVHFASSFAVMARTLGIPSRVVVGYLPGTSTGETDDDGRVTYSVTSRQLHAWPEAYLEGIGWVPFEPTASLGVATNFLPQTLGASESPEEEPESPDAAPSPTPTTGETVPVEDQPPASESDADASDASRSRGIAIGALVAALVLALPLAVRRLRRARRVRARGTALAEAAWLELVDTAIDAGAEVSASESPRTLGARLVADRGAPAADVALLVGAVERAAFARDAEALPRRAAEAALRRIRHALLPSTAVRIRAAVLPRSLVVRPGLADDA
ncbi:DUF3488 and transglutaminase-like domain-containing protein [Microbacterium betulae]|uniref:DUF3488 and transglutaminase-like domain-containing protein n=1 Tax=Microbacterium betulae TaxID=2981139 RepID=A0AA97FKM0_9MICO|nr:DUF3488 and transglutaminase-like domain-containing protein [Microbacterium sp. AB]WOF24050.1 DUF3488 and transglutaminase-like domain-containing protein [Microbacterium sp. AB]